MRIPHRVVVLVPLDLEAFFSCEVVALKAGVGIPEDPCSAWLHSTRPECSGVLPQCCGIKLNSGSLVESACGTAVGIPGRMMERDAEVWTTTCSHVASSTQGMQSFGIAIVLRRAMGGGRGDGAEFLYGRAVAAAHVISRQARAGVRDPGDLTTRERGMPVYGVDVPDAGGSVHDA